MHESFAPGPSRATAGAAEEQRRNGHLPRNHDEWAKIQDIAQLSFLGFVSRVN
jgi:hypothetical protein